MLGDSHVCSLTSPPDVLVEQVVITEKQQGSLQADSHHCSVEVLPGTGADAPAHQRVTSDPPLTQARLSGVPEANIKAAEARRGTY